MKKFIFILTMALCSCQHQSSKKAEQMIFISDQKQQLQFQCLITFMRYSIDGDAEKLHKSWEGKIDSINNYQRVIDSIYYSNKN